MSETLGGSGDPSPATALGVLWAMRAVATRLWGDPSLAGRHVCISGVGKVGAALADHLHEEGARLTVADVRADAAAAVAEPHRRRPWWTRRRRTRWRATSSLRARWAPCSTRRRSASCACAAVVGSANNQLATDEDAERIAEAGVLYAPDYVVNAGGVINIAEEQGGYDHARAEERIERIYDTVLRGARHRGRRGPHHGRGR